MEPGPLRVLDVQKGNSVISIEVAVICALSGFALGALTRPRSSRKSSPNTPTPTEKREPYRTPDTPKPDDLIPDQELPTPEPTPEPTPLRLSHKDLAINADAKVSGYNCRHRFLPSPSEPGYGRCEACGVLATEGFAAEQNKRLAEETAEKQRRAEFVQKHGIGYGVK